MSNDVIRVATRKSALALAQAGAWMKRFERETGCATLTVEVVTTGDRIVDRALNEVGGKGLFIKEIEEALLEGRADVAVHSLKDVPAVLADGLVLGCVPEREDPRDVIVTRSGCGLSQLPPGARVGTSSLRRVTQLRVAHPELAYVPIRGNVDTRLSKCEQGVVDAVVLAAAGMKRLGVFDRVTHPLEPELCLPAVGQGALVIEHRRGDERIAALLAPLEDRGTRRSVAAERGLLEAVEGNCQLPVAGYAVQRGSELWLRGMLAEPDGSRLRTDELASPWPQDEAAATELGRRLGRALLARS
jgi:hydroxymethylbilane synthase